MWLEQSTIDRKLKNMGREQITIDQKLENMGPEQSTIDQKLKNTGREQCTIEFKQISFSALRTFLSLLPPKTLHLS
jgi:hypothetical protein